MKVKSQSQVAQSFPTLSNPMVCSLPGSSVHGIFQARVLEWGAIAFICNKKGNVHLWASNVLPLSFQGPEMCEEVTLTKTTAEAEEEPEPREGRGARQKNLEHEGTG